jgi:hypothetical protein
VKSRRARRPRAGIRPRSRTEAPRRCPFRRVQLRSRRRNCRRSPVPPPTSLRRGLRHQWPKPTRAVRPRAHPSSRRSSRPLPGRRPIPRRPRRPARQRTPPSGRGRLQARDQPRAQRQQQEWHQAQGQPQGPGRARGQPRAQDQAQGHRRARDPEPVRDQLRAEAGSRGGRDNPEDPRSCESRDRHTASGRPDCPTGRRLRRWTPR